MRQSIKERPTSKILKLLLEVWKEICHSNQDFLSSIDSHEWENKIENYRLSSNKPY